MIGEHYRGREQSQVKHKVLERYLQAFSAIIGTKFDEIVYVDCMAGPWEAKDAALRDTSFHTAISVFQDCLARGRCKSVRALLIESDREKYPLLEAYGKSVTGLEVVTEPWDFTKHVNEIVRFAKRSKNSFPFFFIDPTGWTQVSIDAIRPILQVDPGEVLINFMTSWIKRFFDDPQKPFHELFGHEELTRLRGLSGEELEDEIVNVYAARIRKVGRFAYTCAIPIMMPDRDDIHYHLIYGTRSYRGLEEFKKTEDVSIRFMHDLRAAAQRRDQEEKNPQGFLLSAAETYRERRFRLLNGRRKANARAAVIQLLETNAPITYGTLYQESMQYSTVVDSDLRQWLEEWQRSGSIRFGNWTKGQKVPHRDTTVQLTGPLP
ncbi:MAG: three-Cys-motif partner protein TcmP [Acidobacteriaceae bacterium]